MQKINNQNNKEFKSFYKTVGGGEGDRCNYPTRLDLYGCGCQHDCNYCVWEGTLILMYDGTTKKIKDIKVGDKIYGVLQDGIYHKYVESTVLNHWKVEKQSYKITLENGVELICSANHRWLTNQGWKYTIGEETGLNSTPFLTTNDKLIGLDNDEFLSSTIKGEGNLNNTQVKDSNNLKVRSIEFYKEKEILYDITTSTENFIANGIVSHNCYAKSLLDFRNLWNNENPSVANIEKVKKTINKIPDDVCVRLGGMTDCFQPLEKSIRNTYEAIKELNKQRKHYLIVTKSHIVADDEYIEILDKDLAHIQISVTTTNDELAKTYERASLPSERIRAIEKLSKLGFDVQLRLSPFIPEYIDFNILNNVQCDKILVEFLRVNSWIKKWFHIDYTPFTLKEGGYNHLPLDIKIEYLRKINGFKEISICEDVNEHFEYWKEHINANKYDCCNLKINK